MGEADLSTDQLTEIFHAYSTADIVEAQRSTEAFANEVYDVTDSEGQRFFLKLLKTQLPEAVSTEVHMQRRLLAAGLRSPEYLEIRPGEYVGSHDKIRFILSRYIPGESPKDITPGLIESFGATLARIHDALAGVDVPPNTMQWLNPDRIEADLGNYDGEVKAELRTLVDAGKVIFEHNLPTAVTHGDLWMSNVFAENDVITTVFDLETAEHTVRLVDLARTFTSMRFNSELTPDDVITALTKGYDSAANAPLTPDEQSNFMPAIAFVSGACATWHAVHGTRYRDRYIAFGKEALQRISFQPQA
ncbi:MAG TPA: phosphotransferase [Candidatus Saccharimonadales bacterium]|jgi:Ser/Thr protein kinase RdoA (MazF antagonist)